MKTFARLFHFEPSQKIIQFNIIFSTPAVESEAYVSLTGKQN